MKRSDYGTDAYRQGFIDGINLKDNNEISIMGYNLFEVFDIMEKYMSDKTKVTLTRQAAADMLRRHTLDGYSNIDNMINFYVEAGMLEVVEEKEEDDSAFDEFVKAMKETAKYEPKYTGWEEIRALLKKNGLKIIKR